MPLVNSRAIRQCCFSMHLRFDCNWIGQRNTAICIFTLRDILAAFSPLYKSSNLKWLVGFSSIQYRKKSCMLLLHFQELFMSSYMLYWRCFDLRWLLSDVRTPENISRYPFHSFMFIANDKCACAVFVWNTKGAHSESWCSLNITRCRDGGFTAEKERRPAASILPSFDPLLPSSGPVSLSPLVYIQDGNNWGSVCVPLSLCWRMHAHVCTCF